MGVGVGEVMEVSVGVGRADEGVSVAPGLKFDCEVASDEVQATNSVAARTITRGQVLIGTIQQS